MCWKTDCINTGSKHILLGEMIWGCISLGYNNNDRYFLLINNVKVCVDVWIYRRLDDDLKLKLNESFTITYLWW